MKTSHALNDAAARPRAKKQKVGAAEENIGQKESAQVLDWNTAVVLIALIKDRSSEVSASENERFVFISPSTRAFDELTKQSPFISELWILAAGSVGRGISYIDRVAEVSSWTAHTTGGRPLLVLRGEGGHLLGVDDDGIFVLKPSAVHWSGEGVYQGAPAPSNTRTD